jgi:hypothetical protein
VGSFRRPEILGSELAKSGQSSVHDFGRRAEGHAEVTRGTEADTRHDENSPIEELLDESDVVIEGRARE